MDPYLKVLHITNWYPNKWNPLEGVFIREHFEALSLYADCELWHVQVRNEGAFFKIESGNYSGNEHYLILNTRVQSWFFIERLHFLLLFILRWKIKVRQFQVINFHVAYPLLRFTKIVQRIFKKKIIITDHWSAYRKGFNLPAGNKARKRIESIFHHQIPVITVSRALMNDIKTFAGVSDFPQFVVPNVVDVNFFYPAERIKVQEAKTRFLMVAEWAPIKRPFLVLEAFRQLAKQKPAIELSIIGKGHQWEAMVQFVKDNGLEQNIFFLGRKNKVEIGEALRKTDVFLLPSEYETFSVVCAEAQCCGIPVIASDVGGVKEVVGAGGGILVQNTVEDWAEAMQSVLEADKHYSFNTKEIAHSAANRFSKQKVGQLYYDVVKQCIQ
jgi:glycosyltransferase involved in cell wall biosynthesis